MIPLAVVFAGGGTGGHLFPALAVHEALGDTVPAHYLCSNRPLDAEILAAAQVEFTPLAAAPPVPRPGPALRFVTGWGRSVRETRRVLRNLKQQAESVVMVTMGGFVAPPCVRAARVEGVPIVMVNLDAVPGLANRFIAPRVTEIVSAIAVPGRPWPVVPPVVREGLRVPRAAGEARARYALDPDIKTMLITGGSQGARSVGELVLGAAEQHPEALHGWQVLHQTHNSEVDAHTERWRALSVRAEVRAFLDDMPAAWWAADLHVGRCGAGTVAEACATRTPSVFLPYPWHKDQHQRRNAEALVEAGAAVLCTDHIDAKANLTAHAQTLHQLWQQPERLEALRLALAALPEPNGAAQVAGRVWAQAKATQADSSTKG